MNLEMFCSLPPVLEALMNPRSSRSVLNYMCACDTSDPVVRESLNTDEKVEPYSKYGSKVEVIWMNFVSPLLQ